MKNLFKNNQIFFKLWLSQIAASFGDSFYDVAIVWHIVQLTESALLAGGIALTGMVGRMAGSSFISQKVDVWHTRQIMLVAGILRGILLLTVVGLISFTTIPISGFYGISFIIAFLNSCASAAQRKSISEIVAKEDLVNANASFGVAFSLVQITSWALGGVVVNILGVILALIINAVTTIASAILIASSSWKSMRQNGKATAKVGVLEGLSVIRNSTKSVKLVVILELISLFLMGFYWAAFPLLVHEISNAVGYGLQGAAFGVGCLITSVYLARNKHLKKLGLAYLWGVIFYAIGVVVSATISHIAIFIFGVFISGLGNSFWETARQTILHLSIPTEDVGKVFAVFELLIHLCLIPAWLLGGFLADTFSPRLVMMVVGITMLTLLLFALQSKSLQGVTTPNEKLE